LSHQYKYFTMKEGEIVDDMFVELSKRAIWPGPPQIGPLVSQPNPTQLLVILKKLKSVWPITG